MVVHLRAAAFAQHQLIPEPIQITPKNAAILQESCISCHQALVHWDYRVENLFFKVNEPDVAVIDWQLMMWMKPAWDFTYLCFTNIRTEDRHAWFDDLATLYLEELALHGVEGYSRRQLDEDVRLCLPGITVAPVIGGASFDETNDRSRALFEAVAKRVFSGIDEMECMTRLGCVA